MPAYTLPYRPIASAHSSLLTAHSSLFFTFSAKEKDAESGLSVTSLRSVSSSSLNQTRTSSVWCLLIRRFGSRYYSSDLSLWLSVDPMADKYPSLSPYVYCADNPVKLVDPNGEEIVIEWRNSVYRYEQDGTLTLIKGNALNDRQLNRFIGKAQKSLNKINKTTEGNRMIVDLQDSETQFTIKTGASGYEKKEANTITWNSNGTRLPVQGTPFGESNSTYDLAHELSHAFDDNNNWTDRTQIEGLDKNEWVACYRENLIRSELGGNLRTYYRVSRTESGSFQGGAGPFLLNRENKPYMPFDIKSYEKNK